MTHKDFFIWLSGFLSAVDTTPQFESIKMQMSKVEPAFIIEEQPIKPTAETESDQLMRRKSPFKPAASTTHKPAKSESTSTKERVVFRI